MSNALDDYQSSINVNHHWEIKQSPKRGRGVFAKVDFPANSEVFREPALVVGPRSSNRCPEVCVGCHRAGDLEACPAGCGLPVCQIGCENITKHPECSLFCQLEKPMSRQRLALVAPMRAVFLSLDDRKILRSLEGHHHDQQDSLLTGDVQELLHVDDMDIVRTCCEVFDATSYETPTGGGASVRGIYPIAALMNHDCSPNTLHKFDSQGHMVVMTTRPITAGEEITASYTTLTWGTLARRSHLLKTKKFACECRRCSEPSEWGAQLMALYCMKKGCGGVLLPSSSLHSDANWHCRLCGVNFAAKKMSAIIQTVSSVISDMPAENPRVGCRLLRRKSIVPNCNHYAVQFKLFLINSFGYAPGFSWPELTDDELTLKMLLCQQLTLLLEVLNLGACSLLDDLILQKSLTKAEQTRRKS